MTNPQPAPSDDLNGELQRIHQLGSATSTLFNRLFKGFNRRSQAQQLALVETAVQAKQENYLLLRHLQEQEQEIERLHGILASLGEGIIMQDMEGRIVMMNGAARDLLGNQRNFWQSELGTWFNQFRHIVEIGSELEVMDRARRFQIGDKVLGAQLAAVAASSGTRMGTLIILRDVTSDTLAERLKDSIITSISHELKTPMNVMRIASEILMSQPEDVPANRKMLEKLSKNIDVLDRMVLELLDVSEMSGGHFEIQRGSVYLETLFWDVIAGFAADIAKAKLSVRLMLRDTDRLTLLGDETRLKWAFGHLLRNAIAYTQPKGHINIAAKYEASSDQLIVMFRDTGVGIAPPDLPHIFDLFFRGEARTPSGKKLDPRGLGQGLFIARRVAEAHGGYILADSELYHGTEFTVALPSARLPALTAGQSAT